RREPASLGGGLWLGWTSPPRTPGAARVGNKTRAERVIAPWPWPAPSGSLASSLILGDRSVGVRHAGEPLGWHPLHVVGHRLRFLGLPAGRRLGVLLRQWTRMPHHKPEGLRDDTAVAGLALDWPEHALPMPAARCCILGPPRCFHHQRQR